MVVIRWLFILLVCSASPLLAETPWISHELSKRHVSTGEQLIYTATLYGPEGMREPQLSAGSAAFDEYPLDLERSRQVIDRKACEVITYTAALYPVLPGHYRVTGPTLTAQDLGIPIHGESLRAAALEVDVAALPPIPSELGSAGAEGMLTGSASISLATLPPTVKGAQVELRIRSEGDLSDVRLTLQGNKDLKVYEVETSLTPMKSRRSWNFEKRFVYNVLPPPGVEVSLSAGPLLAFNPAKRSWQSLHSEPLIIPARAAPPSRPDAEKNDAEASAPKVRERAVYREANAMEKLVSFVSAGSLLYAAAWIGFVFFAFNLYRPRRSRAPHAPRYVQAIRESADIKEMELQVLDALSDLIDASGSSRGLRAGLRAAIPKARELELQIEGLLQELAGLRYRGAVLPERKLRPLKRRATMLLRALEEEGQKEKD